MKDTTLLLCAALVCVGVGLLGAAEAEEADDPFAGLRQVALAPGLEGSVAYEGSYFVFTHRSERSGLDSELAVSDENGREVFRRRPILDLEGDVQALGLYGAALQPPDRLVVTAGVHRRPDEHSAVLLEYDLTNGGPSRVVQTDPLWCQEVAVGGDGILWCLGFDRTQANARQVGFDLVYRFATDLTLLGSSLPCADLATPAPDPGVRWLRPWDGVGVSKPQLFAGGDEGVRVWLPAVREVVSFAPNGAVRGRSSVPPQLENVLGEQVAVTASGRVFALVSSAGDRAGRHKSLVVLTADGGTWLAVAGAPAVSPRVSLVGADGEALLLHDRAARRVVWLPVAVEPASAD